MHPSGNSTLGSSTPPPSRGLQYMSTAPPHSADTLHASSKGGAASHTYSSKSRTREHPTLPQLAGGTYTYGGSSRATGGAAADNTLFASSAKEKNSSAEQIGPSARRLLGLNTKAADSTWTKDTVAAQGTSKSATVGCSSGEPTGKRASPKAANREDAAAPAGNQGFNNTFSQTMNSTFSKNKTKFLHSSTRATPLPAPTTTTPQLAVKLRTYLDKECQYANFSGDSVESQLEPYREVLGAIGEAFPSYAPLLNEIRTAYDSVVQQQSIQLHSTIERQRARELSTRQQLDDVASLQQHIALLESNLSSIQKELEARERTSDPTPNARTRVADTKNSGEDDALEVAKKRIQELESNSKGDLEKILLLISTVRECDRRMKGFEDAIQQMSLQLEELDVFKRLAGEAQTELTKYKQRFQSFVPSQDFEMMKAHLGEELQSAQNESRRLRRTAAARSTQVDVLNRKLVQLEQDRSAAQQKQAPQQEAGGEATTPRPNWEEIEEEVPAMKDMARADCCAPLDANGLGDEGEDGPSGGTKNEILQLKVTRSTAERVRFLVEQLHHYRKEVDEIARERDDAFTQVARSFEKGTIAAPVPSLVKSGGQAGGGKPVAKVTDVPTRTPSLGYPILGPGVGPNVPPHIRICGHVERVVLSGAMRNRIVYGFFTELLQPTMEASAVEGIDVPTHFFHYMESEIAVSAEVRSFFSHPAQIALNLERDLYDSNVTNASLVLLHCILDGVLPARVAVDAATLVAHAMTDLEALMQEQQKKRIRRSALTECLIPILELKGKGELAELRKALGSDTSFDGTNIVGIESRFMSTLFFQECAANIKLYTDVVVNLTNRSKPLESEGNSPEGDRVIALTDLAEAILEAEPQTPAVIIRELTENAVTGGKDMLVTDEERPAVVRLSEAIKVVSTAPIIVRSLKTPVEECTL